MNTRRHGRSHRICIAEIIDESGGKRQSTLYGILENLGGRGLDTHYGMAFKTTGFAFRIIIGSDGNSATQRVIHNMGQGSNTSGPVSKGAWLSFITSTFAFRVIHCLDWILQHRSHYGNRAFVTIVTRQDRLLRRLEIEPNFKGDSNWRMRERGGA